MKKTILLFFTLSQAMAWAEPRILKPFVFALPIDESSIVDSCQRAFDQALEDQKKMEKHQSVQCARFVTPTVHDDLRQRFVLECLNTCKVIAKSSTGSAATMTSMKLAGELSDVMKYAPGDTCQRVSGLDNSINDFQMQNAQLEGTAPEQNASQRDCHAAFNCH